VSDIVFFPQYNTSRVELTENDELFGARLLKSFVPNFFQLYLKSKVFFKHHSFMREEFLKRRGYDFELLVSVLAGLSSFTILPARALYTDNEIERKQIRLSSLMQTLGRGYHLFVGSEGDLLEMLIQRMLIIFQMEFDHNEIERVLASITLDGESQKKISL
jgi:hypothetical protein